MLSTKDPRLNKSKWYKWQDMAAQAAQFVIEAVSIENYAPDNAPKEDYKPTLWLRGEEKGFGLNVGNTEVLELAWGEDMEQWIGQVIELHIEQTMYEGKRVNCLRVHLPQQAAAPVQPLPPAPAPAPQQPVAAPTQPPTTPVGNPTPPAGSDWDSIPTDPFGDSLMPPADDVPS